jgi:pSer/pThr/pTyr-binding forkhead associated (FHA) protein
VSDPLITRFAEACGAAGPLDLRVDLAGGGVLAEGSVGQPFTLVGRDDACDVTLTDPEVNPRHAWLQVLGGRVFAVDLGSRTGVGWPDGLSGSGWLDMGTPIRIGPFRLALRAPVCERPTPFSVGYNPLQSDAAVTRGRPVVNLDFRNGKRVKDRWGVSRLITLVGRSPDCKLHLNAEDIAAYHCGLVLTPTGLWVVDLSGRGVVVSGERMRVAPLPHGAELWVGRFLIGCHYPAISTTPALGRPGMITPSNSLLPTSEPSARVQTPSPSARLSGTERSPSRGSGAVRGPSDTVRLTPSEDEVPLGVVPSDPASGMPSSHIMADAYRMMIGFGHSNGPVSGSLQVSGSSGGVQQPPGDAGGSSVRPGPEAVAAAEGIIVPLIKQLGEVHGQMFDQLQNSMLMMMQMFGQAHRDQMAAIREELGRIQELNGELTKLQAEVARLAMAQAFGGGDETELDLPALSDIPPRPDTTAAMQDWVVERMNTLQRERQSRWQKLVGVLTTKPPAG